jgi:hypothetical protein
MVCAPGTPFANLLRTTLGLLDVPVRRVGDSGGVLAV